MPELNQWLLDNLAVVVGAAGLVLIGLSVALVVVGRRLSKATAAYRALVHETTGASLGDALDAQAARMEAFHQELSEVGARYAQLETRSRGSLQHLGLVRFNPFDDTGSNQSFAIAILDDERTGIVISSLHGRDGTRIFAKSIQAGQSAHVLSAEEQNALGMASGELGGANAQRDR